jgi:geranylgeranyl reductase family protein
MLLQPSVPELSPEVWDVIVVGAGPAGAIAARRLATDGWRVLLLDRRHFPREKACGDGLIPDALQCLERNGLRERVEALGWRTDRVALFGPSRTEVQVMSEFVTIPRELLDAELVAGACEAGATLALGTVRSVSFDALGASVVVEGRAPLRSRIALLATGANVSLLEPLGLLARRRASAVAIRGYMRSALPLEHLVVSYDRAILPGYAWIFPLGGGRFNVGCGIVLRGESDARDGEGAGSAHDLRAMLTRFFADFPIARALRAASADEPPTRGAMLRTALTGVRASVTGPIAVIGEMVGTTYPFTGEGIGKAMESAELASDAVAQVLRAGDVRLLAEYPRRLAALRPKYHGYEIAERWLSSPWLADVLFRQARRSAWMRAAMSEMLHERLDPRTIFSVRGMLRALVS